MNNKNNFERISAYLRDEGCPRTPQEISVWTGIKLGDVYEALQGNKVFFREIFDNDEYDNVYLKGWIVDSGYF
jgi:hypothetical protein